MIFVPYLKCPLCGHEEAIMESEAEDILNDYEGNTFFNCICYNQEKRRDVLFFRKVEENE
jgi:hypothetical protein